MEGNVENKSYFWTVRGQRVEITKDVYKGIVSENERVRRLARNEQRCARPNYHYCPGDCSVCRFQVPGIFDELSETDFETMPSEESDSCVEDAIVRKLMLESVYEHANQLVQDGARILKLRFLYDMNSRQIAEQIGVSHTVINRRLTRLMAYFQANKNLF